MPINAVTHIQNTAPSPPSAMAVATPLILPTPTRLASPVAKAWNGVKELPSAARPNHISRILVGKRRNCTSPVVMVKNRPTPNKITMVIFHNGSSKCSITHVNPCSIQFPNSVSIKTSLKINILIVERQKKKSSFLKEKLDSYPII